MYLEPIESYCFRFKNAPGSFMSHCVSSVVSFFVVSRLNTTNISAWFFSIDSSDSFLMFSYISYKSFACSVLNY